MVSGAKRLAVLCATCIPPVSPWLATPAYAQAAGAVAPAEASSEIVVTANKREQSINKVGSTIVAFSGEILKERGIKSLQDIAAAVPGLAFSQSATNTPVLTLRGVGYNNGSLGAYPAVSVYVDQAPLPFAVLASHSAFDLERLEVLKGPQGTLFGQNSTGGAINYIAAKPTRDLEIGGSLGFGRFNTVKGDGYISGPLTENLRARIAVDGQNSDGWQISTTRPYDRNGKQSYTAGRLLLDWDASPAIKFSLNLTAWHDTSQPQAGQYIVLFPQSPTEVHARQLADPFPASNARAADWTPGAGAPRSNRKFYQAALRADAKLSDTITLTSLTSYVDFRQKQVVDGDGSSLIVADFAANDGSITSFNQELRLASTADSAFRWLVGGNFERSITSEYQNNAYADDSNSNPGFNNIVGGSTTEDQHITSYAVFGNVEYELAHNLVLKGGIRYTKAKNEASICEFDNGDGLINGLFNAVGNIFAGLGNFTFTPLTNAVPINQRCNPLNARLVPSLTPTVATLKEHNIGWTVGANYRLSPHVLVYVNASRGYKAGSFPNLAASTTSQFKPATQESVLAFEGGIKAGLFNQKVQINAAAFYYDYTSKQVLGKLRDPIFGTLDVLINVPKSRVFGLESDIVVRPAPGLKLGAAVTYIDSRITDYNGTNVLGQQQDFAGDRLPYAPKFNYALNVDYNFKGDAKGGAFIGLTLAGRSASDTTPGGASVQVPVSPSTRVYPGLVHPFTTNAYATVDARVGYGPENESWKVVAWAKNIFDKYYWNSVVTGFDNSARYAGMPASYGVTVSFKIR